RRVPGSRLLAVLRGGQSNGHVTEQLERRGVARDRIRLLDRQPMGDYFRRHDEADLSLDPFPYNGGITSLDGLWMGAPFITLAGERAAGRAGLSLLANVGATELVARSPDQYVEKAVELARDVD